MEADIHTQSLRCILWKEGPLRLLDGTWRRMGIARCQRGGHGWLDFWCPLDWWHSGVGFELWRSDLYILDYDVSVWWTRWWSFGFKMLTFIEDLFWLHCRGPFDFYGAAVWWFAGPRPGIDVEPTFHPTNSHGISVLSRFETQESHARELKQGSSSL